MSKGDMTEAQFASKVDWEGGILGALDYGLTHEDLIDQDSELAKAVAALEEAYRPVDALAARVTDILDEIEYED